MSKYVEPTRAMSGAGWTNITLCPDDPDTWYMKYANKWWSPKEQIPVRLYYL